MASRDARSPSDRPRSLLGGPLVLAATLFVATVCACLTVLWLLDRTSDPGTAAMVALVVAAVVATVVSAYAEGTWSARVTRTTELGNATRLLAVAAVLLVIPTIVLDMVEERRGPPARSIDAACPEGRVPQVTFEGVEAGTDRAELASCLRWWGILAPDAVTFEPSDTILRGELATLLDRMAATAGAPLPEAPEVPVPDPASPDAGAIARVAAAGVLGAGDITSFDAGAPITRDQLATVLARLHRHVTGGPLPPGEADVFTDLDGNVHAPNIAAVAEAGLIVGGRDRSFHPERALDRGEVGSILARTLSLWVAEGVAALPA